MNSLESSIQTIKRRLRLSNHSPLIGALRPVYDFLLDIFYGSKGLERRIQGEEPLRLLPRYRSISEEPEVLAALKSLARPGGVVLGVLRLEFLVLGASQIQLPVLVVAVGEAEGDA